MKNSKLLLVISGCCSLGIAVLHLIMIFIGAKAYEYFRAGEEMVRMAESGSAVPAIVTSVIVVIFILFGFYALSAAGMVFRVPFVRTGLCLIAIIYTVRGLFVFFQILKIAEEHESRDMLFSLVSLSVGILYTLSLIYNWTLIPARSGKSVS
jgi:hypothetical protein